MHLTPCVGVAQVCVLDRTLDDINPDLRQAISDRIAQEEQTPGLVYGEAQLMEDKYVYASEAVQQINKDIINQDMVRPHRACTCVPP